MMGAIFTLGLTGSAAAALPGDAAIIFPVVRTGFPNAGDFAGVGAGLQTRGYTFTLDTPRSLTHLGMYDYAQGAVTVRRKVGVWDGASNLVATVDIPVGTLSGQDGNAFPATSFYAALPAPVNLAAGEVYAVGIWYDVDNSPGLCMNIAFTTMPGFHYGNAVETGPPGGAFAKPTIARLDRPHAYIGPNLRFATDVAPPPSFLITSVRYNTNQESLTLTWNSEAGAHYTIENTQEFGNGVPTIWDNFITGIVSGGITTTFVIDAPLPGTYYRIRKE